MARQGFDGYLYYNSASFGTPTWVPITNVKDVDLSMDATKIDASDRGSRWKKTLAGSIEAGVTFALTYDTTTAWYDVLHAAFVAGTTVDMAVMDGLIATAGSEGLRGEMSVLQFSRPEPLDGEMVTNVTIAPAPSAEVSPAWMVVAA